VRARSVIGPSASIRASGQSGRSSVHRMWLIDGHFDCATTRDDTRSGTTEGRRTLEDVEGRLRHMDELRIDVQVLYPTRMAVRKYRTPRDRAGSDPSYTAGWQNGPLRPTADSVGSWCRPS